MIFSSSLCVSKLKRLCLYNSVTAAPLLEFFQDVPGVDVLGEATTWQDLASRLLQRSVDLVAVNLDASDGLQIIGRISELCPACGVIGICSAADPQKLIRANRLGCLQFITKPLHARDVQMIVHQALAVRQASVSS
jgi:DNA-binding NtrC family response regulator